MSGAGGAGMSGAGGSAAGGAGGSAGSGECEGTQPAKLVPVAGGYGIDETEVTRCQYKAWLDTGPSTSDQPAFCSWNSSYTPALEWPPADKADHPVVYVDWCDAWAYCKGVGKRLCGKVGGGALAYPGASVDASTSQWKGACTSGGTSEFPYGSSFLATTCNGFGAGNKGTVEVKSMSDCKTPEGVFDLSGNVWEWEDSCEQTSDPQDRCSLRGGSFNVKSEMGMGCGYYYNHDFADRGSTSNGVGFRCCSP